MDIKFNPSTVERYAKEKDWPKIIAITYVILSIVIFGSVFYLVYRGGSKAFNSGASSLVSISGIDSTCVETEQGVYDCYDEATKEKALAVDTWYVYTETKEVVTTAYNSVESQTDSRPCEATDGADICKEMERGILSCATYLAPIGSTLYVPRWGNCIVHDRTNRKYANRIDLYFGGADRIADAFAWGKQTKEVTINYPTNSPRIDN